MRKIVRKHSALVMSFTILDGDVKHYVRIGGQFYFAGRKNLLLSPNMAEPDGLWREPVTDIISRYPVCRSLRELVEHIIYTNMGEKPKGRAMLREWTSIE